MDSVPKYSESTNNPLHFHDVHGENIKLSKNKTIASRTGGFNNGIVFSDRPVALKEPVYVKFLETLPETFRGALRIGFTMNDPVSFKYSLPKHACSETESMHFTWAKPIKDEFAKKDSILYYYVDQSGHVHYGIDSEDYGILYGGIKTSGKLWAVLDIYGSTVAVEFLVAPSATKMELKSNPLNSSFVQTATTSAKASRKRKNDIPLPKVEQKQIKSSNMDFCKLKTGENNKSAGCCITRCNVILDKQYNLLDKQSHSLDKQNHMFEDFYNQMEVFIQKWNSGPDTINEVPSPEAEQDACQAELQDTEIVVNEVPSPEAEQDAGQAELQDTEIVGKLKTGKNNKCASCIIKRCSVILDKQLNSLDKQYHSLEQFHNLMEVCIQRWKSRPGTINQVPFPEAEQDAGQAELQDTEIVVNEVPSPEAEQDACQAELQDTEIVEVQPFGPHQVPVPSSKVRICDQHETEQDVGVLPGEGNDSQA